MNNRLLPQIYRQPESHTLVQQVCRYIAAQLNIANALNPEAGKRSDTSIHVVCISDTHNETPDLPDGDLLIHAGDLTQKGSLSELQAQLSWLASQPHKYKVIVAGNHDILLDQAFDDHHRKRNQRSDTDSTIELDWKGCYYLQDNTITLQFPELRRHLTIFGSPKTPDCGNWAFQYPAIRDVWTGVVPKGCDITVTHCPPALHKDGRGIGDGYLLREIRRVRPLLSVFGHAHDGYGTDYLFHDSPQSALDDIELNHRPILAVTKLAWSVLCQSLFPKRFRKGSVRTSLVNAAVATSREDKGPKPAIEVNI